MKRNLVIIVLMICFSLFVFSSLMSAEFWASKTATRYHYPFCQWAQKIKPENLIKFNSPEQAGKAGYVPCEVCEPPTASK